MGLCVGFDLDMTLIDPRPGMVDVLELLSTEFDVALDSAGFAEALGPPLPMALRAAGAPEELIPELVPRFRAVYPEIVIPQTVALPGAGDALAAVRAAGGRTVVITGKYQPNAVLHLRAVGWTVDAVVGGLWAEHKADALFGHDASAYVGDHLGDIRAARSAGVPSVCVPSGPYTRQQLLAAGADVVLDDLRQFPAWFARVHAGG